MNKEFSGEGLWISENAEEFKRGGNSKVFLVKNVIKGESDNLHALKLFTSDKPGRERHARFLAEIEIVKNLSGIAGCVKCVDHGLHEGRPFYVMPYYAGGTFRDRYLVNEAGSIGIIEKLEHFQGVLQIVKRLHDVGLAIRDIKPQNILIDEQNDPALSDFGLSLWCTTADDERLTSINGQIGSQGYRAPEWLSFYPDVNHRPGDIWGLGRTLWAVLAASNPPNDCETLGAAGNHLKGYLPKEYANLTQSIVTACTAQIPDERPTIAELISQVETVKQHILDAEKSDAGVRRGLVLAMKTFSLQVANSDTFIDATRLNSEVNIKLREVKSCIERTREHLSSMMSLHQHDLDSSLGKFSVFKRESEMVFPLRNYGLTLNLSDNDVWNKSVTLRFDPSQKIQEHRRLAYIYLACYMGLTNDKRFYWLVSSRDQTTQKEYIVDQLETKTLENLVANKLSQLETFVVSHFFDRIEAHFKA
ncbi:protein kinase [Caballeronia sp. SEWSISQ10-4 2]|uniref:protein kinase domain-containing protein n=1 Tax=Caballeronia sp. SEWSISQ10-4 2 TaxID=2937438 RepID=UPI002656CCEA|nr:protein kinase [Caballeronia sp. SEWSISQ10-4 2]MDN7181182.1 protein kinase [Caballeronia sp. SEWSISQ10-4 2]